MEQWKEYIQKVNEDVISDDKKKPITLEGLRTSHVADMALKCSDETWFKRLFVNLFVAGLIECNQKGTVNKSLLITDVANCSNMNWCEFVMNSLPPTKLEWEGKIERFFKGPILVLLVRLFSFKCIFLCCFLIFYIFH